MIWERVETAHLRFLMVSINSVFWFSLGGANMFTGLGVCSLMVERARLKYLS